MRRQRRRSFVVGCSAEDGEDERDAAAHRFGAVEHGGTAEEELLGARRVFPGDDCGAVEEDFDAFAGGEDGGYAAVGVSYVDLGLGREARRDGVQGGGFLGAVHIDDVEFKLEVFGVRMGLGGC